MAPLPLQSPHDEILAVLPRSLSFIHTATATIPNTVMPLQRRQSMVSVPTSYSSLNSGPSPGTVVGIVLGSVAGFLLLLWFLYSCFGSGLVDIEEGSVIVKERKRSHRSSSHRASETVEVRRERPRTPIVERIVVEERRESRPVPVASSEGSRSDEVIVIEEHSPPRRSKSKRESGYRTVDPLAYAGGDRPMREVRKSSSRKSRN
jgi:hypothetical protein